MTPIIGDLIESTVGKVVDKALTYLPSTMTEAEKEAIKLKAKEFAVEESKLAVEAAKVDAADKASARDREVEVLKTEGASWLNKNIVPVLAIGCLSLSFLLFYQVFWLGVGEEKKEVLIYILGVLSSMDMAILTYYFGSSSGSVKKMAMIEDVLNKPRRN